MHPDQQWQPNPGQQAWNRGPYAPPPEPPRPPRNGLGIAAVVLGPVGMLFGLIPLTGIVAIACGITGVILGGIGYSRARQRLATNGRTAMTGVVLSALAVALGIWGMVTVSRAFDQLSTDLDRISEPAAPAAVVEVAAGQPATTSTGLVITTTPLVEQEAEFLGEFTCSTVSYRNEGAETAPYSDFDWKLQNPQGVVGNSGYTGRDGSLGSGELVPGGEVSGEVCFEGGPVTGRYVLIMEQQIALNPDRLAWTNDL